MIGAQILSISLLPLVSMMSQPPMNDDYPYRPVPFTAVRLEDAFWRPRAETNRTVTIPYAFQQCEDTGRIENFKVAGGLSDKPWTGGFGFNDSDVSKIIEGAAYCLTVGDDPELEAYLSDLTGYYEAAQEDDGYLYTFWTARDTVPEGVQVACRPNNERWDNIGSAHELYNAGHMYEAAVALYQATGDRRLLDVATRNADLVCSVFNPDGLRNPPGHQEIEIGLVKLYRATGNRAYLDQARFFLDQRGRAEGHSLYGPYAQDHEPVTEQSEAVGHAVRANYMYAAMADVAALTGDEKLLRAIDRIWNNVVSRKLYLTGGVGATGHGEAYGTDYELPNRTAYAETCAAIANVYWNHRMFLLHGDAKYIDVLERSLYNGVISGVALDGKTFFYTNPLASEGEHARSEWFGCACCPSNITRFIASVGGYMYAVRDDAVHVNLYAASSAEMSLEDGSVDITQHTEYPWNGRITLDIRPDDSIGAFTMKLRIPGWAHGQPVPSDLYRFEDDESPECTLKVNGDPQPVRVGEDGYVSLRRTWRDGDRIVLNLPMPVRRVRANDAVEADRGRAALQRGPIVYCIEHPEVRDGHVHNLVVRDDAPLAPTARADLLGGVTVITGRAGATRYAVEDGARRVVSEPVPFTAIPYYAWAHRGRGEMAVWLADSPESAYPLSAPTIASRAKASASGGDVAALNDQREPASSGDHTHPFLHWWPRKGTVEWVQYELAEPTEVSRVEVYWFDDTGRGECRIPASWRILYRDGQTWKEPSGAKGLGCEKDRYNAAEFDPVTTDALRIEVQLQEGWAAGIHEWRVD